MSTGRAPMAMPDEEPTPTRITPRPSIGSHIFQGPVP